MRVPAIAEANQRRRNAEAVLGRGLCSSTCDLAEMGRSMLRPYREELGLRGWLLLFWRDFG